MPDLRKRLLVLGGLSCITGLAFGEGAAAFPSKPIRMVVGYAPGGAADTLARLLGAKFQEKFGQPMIVENRPGAAGFIAADTTAKAPPDGYTLFLSDDSPLGTAAGIGDPRAVGIEKSLASVVGLTTVPMVLIVPDKAPEMSVKDLIASAVANPGKLNYASAGNGNISHVAAELFKSITKTSITHVPYRGGVPALSSLLSGETQMMFSTIPTALSYLRSGNVKALAVADERRSLALPDIPTFQEAGLTGMVAVSWHGVVAPNGTSKEVIRRIGEGLTEILRSREISDRLKELGYAVTPRGAAEFRAFMRSETEKWRKLSAIANIKPDA